MAREVEGAAVDAEGAPEVEGAEGFCLDVPGVPDGKLPGAEPYDWPVILTRKRLDAMEASTAGTLVRRGPCFHLSSGPEEAVILWEEGTMINPADEPEVEEADHDTAPKEALEHVSR